MTPMAMRVELEGELTWRIDELRFLRNQLADIPSYSDKKRFRKALVVTLYSHYEGFCKFAMLLYVKAVNEVALPCQHADPALIAGSWQPILTAMEFGDKKCRFFKGRLPANDALHRFARRREFVENIQQLLVDKIQVPKTP